MSRYEMVKESMAETRRQVEKIGYFEGALKCSWAEIALAHGADPIMTFWALRRLLGSDEQKYQQEVS